MADIEENTDKDKNGISVFDYFDIYIGATIEDQLADKVRSQFVFVNGKIDPDSMDEVDMYKASVESFVSNIFDNGRNPVMPTEIPVSLANKSGCILFTNINNGYNTITYESRAGLPESQTLPATYSAEYSNRLITVSDILPGRKPSQTDITSVFDESGLKSIKTHNFLKLFAATNDKYGAGDKDYNLYKGAWNQTGGVSTDLSIGAKIIRVPILIVRNMRELKEIDGRSLQPGSIKIDVKASPNDSMRLQRIDTIQEGYESKDGVSMDLVRFKVVAVSGMCAKIFEERRNDDDLDSALIGSVSYLFNKDKWCCLSNCLPCKIHNYEISGDDLLVDVLIHSNFNKENLSQEWWDIYTGSTLIGLNSYTPESVISSRFNNNTAIGPKPHEDFIPESVVSTSSSLKVIAEEKTRLKNSALSSLNYRDDSPDYNDHVDSVSTVRQLTFNKMLDAEIVFITLIYNPYDISSFVNDNQDGVKHPLILDGKVQYQNTPLDTSRVLSKSDIFDTFGIKLSLNTQL